LKELKMTTCEPNQGRKNEHKSHSEVKPIPAQQVPEPSAQSSETSEVQFVGAPSENHHQRELDQLAERLDKAEEDLRQAEAHAAAEKKKNAVRFGVGMLARGAVFLWHLVRDHSWFN
jgi:hypothetical protein